MILAQDGYGPATKIVDGLDAGYLDGAVISIKYRKPENIQRDISSFMAAYPDKEFFLDQHFYAAQMSMTKSGNIDDHRLFKYGLARKDFTVRNISNISRKLIDHQLELGLSNIIAPSLIISNFNDYTSQASIQLLEESINYLKETQKMSDIKIYLTLAFHEGALLDNENFSQYLDDITLFNEVEGFYLVVERSSPSAPMWEDSRTLSKLMYTVKVLSNNYKVICGFTDFPGLLLLSVGANHVASGWAQSLRNYHSNYFLTQGGGLPRDWFTSSKLLSHILLTPDLKNIIDSGDDNEIIDPTYAQGRLDDPNSLVWPKPIACLQQWKVFREVGIILLDSSNKTQKMKDLISSSQSIRTSLLKKGVVLDRNLGSHYNIWTEAIDKYEGGVL